MSPQFGHQGWATSFEEKFLHDDKGVPSHVIHAVNDALRGAGRLHLLVHLQPTVKTVSMALRGEARVAQRRRAIEALQSTEASACLSAARQNAAFLQPIHGPQEEEQRRLFEDATTRRQHPREEGPPPRRVFADPAGPDPRMAALARAAAVAVRNREAENARRDAAVAKEMAIIADCNRRADEALGRLRELLRPAD